MSATFHSLKIKEKIEETPDARSIKLEIPQELKQTYKFDAGQYITIKIVIGGNEYRRAYSIFTAPFDEDLGFTVKRLKDGKVSNYLIDNLKAGDQIEVMKPEGKFVIYADSDIRRDHYFFAAGSGITPVISMIKTVAEKEPQSTINLLYGNRDEESIIFRKALDYFVDLYKDQINVTYILSRPEKKGLGGLFRKKSKWKGLKGRIDAVKISEFLATHESRSGENLYYLCGPGDMILTAEEALIKLGIEKHKINREYFSNPDQKEEKTVGSTSSKARLKVKLNGSEAELEMHEGKTILETLIDEGFDPPYSCTSGACSTCVAKIEEGKAEMDVCFALDDDEIEKGYILTCQARPTTDVISLDFED